MNKEHNYHARIKWSGNRGSGTSAYRSYGRDFIVSVENKPDIAGSSDPFFLGDKTRHNPEEMLVASLSSCHMLWYLHLCAEAKIVVTAYSDNATGIMSETGDGSGYFESVTLNPVVVLSAGSDVQLAISLHKTARSMCFIANSVNFPVLHHPQCIVESL